MEGNNSGNPSKMREVLVEKVTVNIGVGSPGDRLEYAKSLIEKLSGSKPVETTAKKRNPVFKLRVGMPIGVKVTLRGKKATEFIDKALTSRKRMIRSTCFDNRGNFSFGVPEYIDFPGAKYDPKIGMFGFDVCVTLKRRGARVQHRRLKAAKVGKAHLISKDAAMDFAKSVLNAKIEE